MPRSPRPRRALPGRFANSALAGLAIGFSLVPNFGCGREFFRHWADQDATEAIFEKSRDPRWRLERLTLEPPRSRASPIPITPTASPRPPTTRRRRLFHRHLSYPITDSWFPPRARAISTAWTRGAGTFLRPHKPRSLGPKLLR